MDIKKPTVDLLIVNYQTGEKLRNFLPSLITSLSLCDYKILINNNDSNEIDLIADLSNNERIAISNSENIGFGAAINYLASLSIADFILIANPDCQIHEGCIIDMINQYLEIEKSGKIGFLGAQLFNEDLAPDISWGEFPTILEVFFRSFFLHKIFPRYYEKHLNVGKNYLMDTIAEVPYASGAFILIRKNIFLDYKGFDKCYFAYFEETDLSKKLSANGYKNYITPLTKLIHYRGNKGFANLNSKLYIKSQYIYFKNNKKSVFVLLILNLISISLRIPITGFKNYFVQLRYHFQGIKNVL
jgi:N-acetylglucosaminyl-diphospho-decaprenol L-rhamnosyltransferase